MCEKAKQQGVVDNCDSFKVRFNDSLSFRIEQKRGGSYYISDGNSTYVMPDLTFSNTMAAQDYAGYGSQVAALELLKRFQQERCGGTWLDKFNESSSKEGCRKLEIHSTRYNPHGTHYIVDVESKGHDYLNKDGVIRKSVFSGEVPLGMFGRFVEAVEVLQKYEEGCESGLGTDNSNAAGPLVENEFGNREFAEPQNRVVTFSTEGETSPVVEHYPLGVRVVTDKNGGRAILQIQTPESPVYFSVARLEVKGGKVVMFRERGVESEFVNTDSEGRIQN
jgi:hypothetical protein